MRFTFSLCWLLCFTFATSSAQGNVGIDSLHTIFVSGVAVSIIPPKGQIKADILVLPGWNFSRGDWCQHSTLCREAAARGYRLIMPEMGKSIYASRYYPETRAEWRKYPTRIWLTDTLIPYLQKQGICKPGGKNYLLGLSTGGRGVALVALYTQGLFKAGAALSGDFDQTLQPEDILQRDTYGTLTAQPARWVGEDNPARHAAEMKTALYLGHGQNDNVCPWQQTQHYYDLLRRDNPGLPIRLHVVPTAGHNYEYWQSELPAVFAFFEAH